MNDKYVVIISVHADPAMAPGYDEWGGTHTYMKELLDDFGEHHIHTLMFTRKSMDKLLDCEQYNDYATVYRLKNGPEELIDKNLLYKYHEQNKKEIKSILEPFKDDIVSLHSVYWNSGRIAMELSAEWNIPFVHSVISNEKGRLSRGASSQSVDRIKFEENIFEAAKTILCVSEDEKTDLIRFYNIDERKIIVAGQKIDTSFLSPCQDKNGFPRLNTKLSLEAHKQIAEHYNLAFQSQGIDHFWMNKSFTYLGRVYYNKGVTVIIESWLELYKKHKELTPSLWIIGGSLKEIEETRMIIKKNIYKDLNLLEKMQKIIWWGCLDYQSISTLFLKSLALIMHSYYEPGGRVIVEAMASGLPVLATPNGFGKDYIHDWQNGFITNYGDVKELSLKMEYFIRQPYISPVMGENAQAMAHNIIQKWNFFYNHLIAYGLREANDDIINLQMNDCLFKREVNIYPFYNKSASYNAIQKSVTHFTQEKEVIIQPLNENSTSHVYTAKTSTQDFVVKEVYHRFTLSPLYNPIDKTLIRNKVDFYNLEKELYQLYYPQYLFGFDDYQRLLIIKKHKHITEYSKKNLERMIDFLEHENPKPNQNEENVYKQIMSSSMDNILCIKNTFTKLNHLKYYFECTGFFSAKIAWNIAPILLEYNKEYFNEKTIKNLQQYIQYYTQLPKEDFSSLTLVNMDLAAHHFMEENDHIVPIDFEKLCIGIPEANIACLLYDYTCREYLPIIEVLDMIDPNTFHISLVLQLLVYRYFYQIIMFEVMRKNTYFLYDKLETIHKYSLKFHHLANSK